MHWPVFSLHTRAELHEVYEGLFGKIGDLIKGKHLLIVPSGRLTQLPFQVLVTEKPDTNIAGIDALRHAAWLAKSNAITVLPAVSSLKALREYARASNATKVFMGIGNPLLLGPQGIDRRAWEKQSCPRIINKRIAFAETSG